LAAIPIKKKSSSSRKADLIKSVHSLVSELTDSQGDIKEVSGENLVSGEYVSENLNLKPLHMHAALY